MKLLNEQRLLPECNVYFVNEHFKRQAHDNYTQKKKFSQYRHCVQ